MTPAATALSLTDKLNAARDAARVLAQATTAQKNTALRAIADSIMRNESRILPANQLDLANGRENDMAEGLLDRLRLDEKRLAALSHAVLDIIALPDPVGDVVRGSTLANGLRLTQVRVPFGVVGAIYEARPNVTVDIAALALKSGNAAVMRGGSAAENTNRVLVEVIQSALVEAGLPAESVQTIDEFGRDGATQLMRARGLVDVLIPRGSAGLINSVVAESTVPVIETGVGNCHVYVDAAADLDKALAIAVNSKTHRVSVCNAAESLLVHRSVAEEFLPRVLAALGSAGVTVHGDAELELAAKEAGAAYSLATDDDFAREYLSLDISVRVVESLDEALAHVRRYTTGHTEAIVTEDRGAARRWVAEVDAAVVMVNASTRFTDGGEFGFGAEISISTQKLHARGPMGLAELTTTKWVVEGDGQIRQ